MSAKWDKQTDLDDKLDGLVQRDILLIVLLQKVLCSLLVGPDGRCLPAAVVAAGVALVQLEAPVFIPADQIRSDQITVHLFQPHQAAQMPALICMPTQQAIS